MQEIKLDKLSREDVELVVEGMGSAWFTDYFVPYLHTEQERLTAKLVRGSQEQDLAKKQIEEEQWRERIKAITWAAITVHNDFIERLKEIVELEEKAAEKARK